MLKRLMSRVLCWLATLFCLWMFVDGAQAFDLHHGALEGWRGLAQAVAAAIGGYGFLLTLFPKST